MTEERAAEHRKAQEISVTVDGVEVRGVITHRSASDIDVSITSPYRNISGGLHIMYLASAVFSFEGQYGDERAEDTLRSIYRIGRFVEQELPGLRERYAAVMAEIDRLNISDVRESQWKRRLELRALLRRGEIDARSYQKELAGIRKVMRSCEDQADGLIRQFFDENFPMIVPGAPCWGTAGDVRAILEGRAGLLADTGEAATERRTEDSDAQD